MLSKIHSYRLLFSAILPTGIYFFVQSELHYFYCTQEVDPNERAESVGLLGKGPLPLPATVNIQPPSTGDDYDSDSSYQSEDENRPLTQQELRQRIVKGVSFVC